MEQSSRTTGAIGDLNKDNKLDLVLTFNAQGIIKEPNGNYIRSESTIDLVVINLEEGFSSYPILQNKKTIVKSSDEQHMHSKPKGSQIWTGYMGYDSLSTYTPILVYSSSANTLTLEK